MRKHDEGKYKIANGIVNDTVFRHLLHHNFLQGNISMRYVKSKRIKQVLLKRY